MRISLLFMACLATAWSSLADACAHAALPIQLEVAVQQDAPLGAMQEWGRVLSEMDLARVQLRGARGDDQPAVETIGEGAAAHYSVTAVLTRGNDLIIPGGKFNLGQRAQLKQFLQELPERVVEAGIERGPFGLPVEKFAALLEDLSTTVTESTAGQRPEPMVVAIAAGIETRLLVSPAARDALRAAPLVDVELKGMSSGAALAAVLRTANLAMVPLDSKTQPLVLQLVRASAPEPTWPIGWKPPGAPKQVAPAMYEFTTIEIDGYSLAQALEALGPHMGVPLVFDQRMLAERKIDPAAVQVKLSAGKTYIRRAVDRILSQGRLAGELRIDDAGRPFYWITQFGKESPRATELKRVNSDK